MEVKDGRQHHHLPSTAPKAFSQTAPSFRLRGIPKRMTRRLSTKLNLSYADIPFLVCCLISGLVDSTIYNAYGTFVSMQTGNTIFVGLGGSTSHDTSKPYGWVKSLTSIACFVLGCVCFSRASRLLGPTRRGTLAASFLAQAVFILVTAGIVQGGVVEGRLRKISDDIAWRQLLPIGLLSFQSAGQIVGSRALNYSEIPTIVVTSMLHDIASDPEVLGSLRKHPKRNRRVVAFVGILVGAVAGGFIGESSGRMQVPLWIAGGLKLCISVAWLIWPASKG